MACNNQPGPAAYRRYIEQMSGQKITQQEWHDLRKLVELEGGGVSRSRVTPEEAAYVAAMLGGQMRMEFGENPETKGQQNVAFDEMVDGLNSANVTQATANIIRYLANNGVKDSLALARQYRKNGGTLIPSVAAPAGSEAKLTERVELDGDDIICLCGNTTRDSGFYPYTNGVEVEPDASWDGKSKFCAACNRVFDFETGEVSAQPDHITLLDPYIHENEPEAALAAYDRWWEDRVAHFESEGMTTSDAQAAADAEEILRRRGK